MFSLLKSTLLHMPKPMRVALRERAIKQVHNRIQYSGRCAEDLSDSEREWLVKEEEDRIISQAKNMSITALAAMLGISWI